MVFLAAVLAQLAQSSNETNVLVQFYGMGVDCGSVPDYSYTSGEVSIDSSSGPRTPDLAAYITHFAMGGDGNENNPSLHGFQTGNNFVAVLSGTVPISVAGSYTFSLRLGSMDTATVLIDGAAVLITGCSWGTLYTTAETLTAGYHLVHIIFADDGYSDTVTLEYSGPDTNGVTMLVPTVSSGGDGGYWTCLNTCGPRSDNECDDGGAGSEYSLCALGTDCVDCGPRLTGQAPLAVVPVPPPPPTPRPPLGDGAWLLSGEGQSCDTACAASGAVCNEQRLLDVASAYDIEYVAEQAGVTCTGGTVGWQYPSNPGICSHGGCCGDADGDGYGDCEGICAWGPHADRSCSARAAHYARLCPCEPDTTSGGGGGGMCDNTCWFASDDDCDDGGPGAGSASICSYGTDCDDCGVRVVSPPSPCTPDPYAICLEMYAPVCGSDGITYPNECTAAAACQLDATDGACSSDPAPPPSPAQIYGSVFEGGHLRCVGVPSDWNHGHPSYGAATGECRDEGLPVSSVSDQMTVLDLTGRGLSAECLGNCNWRNCHNDDDMAVCYEACAGLGLEGCCQWRSYGPDCIFVHGTRGTQTDGNSDTFAALFSAVAPVPDPSPPPPPPVAAGECTPEWGDCTAAGSWCCDDAGGLQCMRQNEYYAQCRQECPALREQNVPWECSDAISGPAASCAEGWTWAGGSCFQAFARGSTAPTFDAANEACGAHMPGATLAKIESSVQNNAAADAVGSASEYIIGLRTADSDGTRYWADDTVLAEDHFEAQWHWDLRGDECVRLVGSAHHWHARGWDDWPCEAYAGYVCSYVAAEAPPSSPSPAPAEQGCVDIDVRAGATDVYFDGCAEYAGNAGWCTFFDDNDFTAAEMCCACGGGETGFAPPPPPPSCVDSDTQGQLDIGGDGCSAYIVDWFCGGYWDDNDFTASEMCCICGGGVQNHGGDVDGRDDGEACSDNEQALMLPSLVQLLMEQFFGGVQCLEVAQLLGPSSSGDPDMAQICQADRAQLDQWLSAGLADYPAIGALLGGWRIPDEVQNVATDLCAATCEAYGFGPCASTDPPAPPTLPLPSPPPPGVWDEQRCADECRALGYCCGDHTVGSNQFLSCSQACMIRVRGSSTDECTAACDEERGCRRDVNGYTYGMCGSCEDLDLDGDGNLECVYGVQSTEACHVGCGLGVLLPPQPPSPEPSPPPPPHPLSPIFSLPSPPPPEQPHSPPPDGASVAVVLVAAGDVGDYDASVQFSLRTRLADAAAVDVSRVALSVEAASVRLAFSVWGFGSGASAEADAASVGYALKEQMESGDDASALLGVSIEEAPLVAVGGEPVAVSPSPPPSGADTAPSAPRLPGLDAGTSALSADEGEDGGGGGRGKVLLVVAVLVLALALLALGGACVVLRRAKRGPTAAGGASWPRSIVASQPLPNVVAAQVAQLPPLVQPPVQGTVIQAVVAGASDAVARPACARLASTRGSSSDVVAQCMGSNDVELAPVVSPLTVPPTRLPLPVGAAPPLETKDGAELQNAAALEKGAAGTSVVSV